jgi:hypothetical protein
MSTNRTFQAMLNEYLPNELLKEELIKRDFVLNKVNKDDTWATGNLVVPFKAAGASSVSFGSLTASTDIAEDKYVRGGVSAAKEVWGSMIFNHRDIMEHGKISEQNLLKLLPNTIDDFMDYMKSVVSQNLLTGDFFATITADATANTGVITVDHPDRFVIGQKVYCVDATAGHTVLGYVTAIDMNAKTVTLEQVSRGSGTVVNFSSAGNTMTAANKPKVYNDGAQTGGTAFKSLRGTLLSAANGGDAQLYGVTKTLYPYLQAINVSGAAITSALSGATSLLNVIFDALTSTRQFGKGSPTDVIMSFKNFGQALKIIEASKGAFNVVQGSQKASQFGWTEIEIGSVTKGGLKLVQVQEMDDDIIILMDWRAATFYSNGFFQKRMSPDGEEYFEIRASTGYQYIVDICLFGELVMERPSYCGIIYGINY